jgi:hypothetical protein
MTKKIGLCLCGVFSLAVFAIAGCNSGSDSKEVIEVQVDFVKDIKDNLKSVADSGRLGSGMSSVASSIRQIEKTDPSKAASIKKAVDELTALQDPNKLKAKAKQIIASL